MTTGRTREANKYKAREFKEKQAKELRKNVILVPLSITDDWLFR